MTRLFNSSESLKPFKPDNLLMLAGLRSRGYGKPKYSSLASSFQLLILVLQTVHLIRYTVSTFLPDDQALLLGNYSSHILYDRRIVFDVFLLISLLNSVSLCFMNYQLRKPDEDDLASQDLQIATNHVMPATAAWADPGIIANHDAHNHLAIENSHYDWLSLWSLFRQAKTGTELGLAKEASAIFITTSIWLSEFVPTLLASLCIVSCALYVYVFVYLPPDFRNSWLGLLTLLANCQMSIWCILGFGAMTSSFFMLTIYLRARFDTISVEANELLIDCGQQAQQASMQNYGLVSTLSSNVQMASDIAHHHDSKSKQASDLSFASTKDERLISWADAPTADGLSNGGSCVQFNNGQKVVQLLVEHDFVCRQVSLQ